MSTAEERGLSYRQDVLVKNTEGKEISPSLKVRNSNGKRGKRWNRASRWLDSEKDFRKKIIYQVCLGV